MVVVIDCIAYLLLTCNKHPYHTFYLLLRPPWQKTSNRAGLIFASFGAKQQQVDNRTCALYKKKKGARLSVGTLAAQSERVSGPLFKNCMVSVSFLSWSSKADATTCWSLGSVFLYHIYGLNPHSSVCRSVSHTPDSHFFCPRNLHLGRRFHPPFVPPYCSGLCLA